MTERKKSKILIIEDEDTTAAVLSEFLELRGYEILWSKDGIDGLEKVFQVSPDLVLLDLMIPGMNGLDVLLEIKSKTQTQSIPVVVCSAVDRINGLDSWAKWGALAYLSKPFDLNEVFRTIHSALT